MKAAVIQIKTFVEAELAEVAIIKYCPAPIAPQQGAFKLKCKSLDSFWDYSALVLSSFFSPDYVNSPAVHVAVPR